MSSLPTETHYNMSVFSLNCFFDRRGLRSEGGLSIGLTFIFMLCFISSE